MKIPEVLLIEVEHAPGNLAKVLAAVGASGHTVEGLEAVSRTQNRTRWELTIELDDQHESDVFERINEVPVAQLIGRSDRVFKRHEGGKIRTKPTARITDLQTLRDIYTPGVARVCLAIRDRPELVQRYTNIQRTVAIVTDGSAILGLGDIGPRAGLPVMEGKAALFSQLAAVTGVPILLDTKDPDEVIRTVRNIAPTFGAIQLEDIAAPHCFRIERELAQSLDMPVLHDDQHGTATVVLAACITACKRAGVDLSTATVGQIGLGAAGLGIARLLRHFGIGRLLGADLRDDAIRRLKAIAGEPSTLEEIMRHADVVIATTGVRGLIRPDLVREGQVILALTNPDPEIEPNAALARGAAFCADGKNVNNVLAFPGLFRGALDACATRFTDAMLIAAARAIADATDETHLVPPPLETEVADNVACAVAEAATEGGEPIMMPEPK